MWVVSVEKVLGMTGKLQPHQVLKSQGLLVEWNPKMFTIFVSHKWLGHQYPDMKGEHFEVLKGFLQNLIARKIKVENDAVSQFFGGNRTLTKAENDQIEGAYIWLDYFCVPQIVNYEGEHELEALRAEQLQYVHSIPAYVDHCQMFFALVPNAMHNDTLSNVNYYTWLDSGWCRTEFWCKLLSTRSNIPIIVVTGKQAAKFSMPMWFRHPVHSGQFLVERDREACSQVIQTALDKHLSELSRSKNQMSYRLYLALYEDMGGLKCKQRSMQDFLWEFSFSQPLQQYKGLGPAACAALTGDDQLLRSVVAAKASLQTRAPAIMEVMNIQGFTPLHFAVWFRSQDLQILETLLELRADVNSSTLSAMPPVHLCRTVGALELLVRHGAGVNFQGKQLPQWCAVHNMAAYSVPTEVLARLLELKANVNGGRGGTATQSPLHSIAYAGSSNNDLRSAQLLLDNKADINQVLRPEGMMRNIELMSRAYRQCCREPSLVLRVLTDLSTTALGWSVMFDNEEFMVFLLRARADPEIKNNRGLRPLDFAKSERLRRILRDPAPHIYLLEHYSESISNFL